MKCSRCNSNIPEDEGQRHLGEVLCEDCYMEALSPPKACDPWAVHSATTLAKHSKGDLALNKIQEKIIQFLKDNDGRAEPVVIMRSLQLEKADLEREVASLRHMEKVRAQKEADIIYLSLW